MLYDNVAIQYRMNPDFSPLDYHETSCFIIIGQPGPVLLIVQVLSSYLDAIMEIRDKVNPGDIECLKFLNKQYLMGNVKTVFPRKES